jgi:hypothetical protein
VNTAQGTSIGIWESIKYAPDSLMDKCHCTPNNRDNKSRGIRNWISYKKNKVIKKQNIKEYKGSAGVNQ